MSGKASNQNAPGPGQGPGAGQPVPLDQQAIQVEVPADALERLKGMRGGDGKRGLFTSDLSVNEFLLVKEAGFDPVGMVVGSSIYHIGYQPVYLQMGFSFGYGFNYADQELQVLTQAKYQARELAMARMEAEASALGADGIVGVRLDTGEYDWGPDLMEFMAVGTAVRARDGASYKTRFGKPFTSDLSGQDVRTLLRAGYKPLGLVLGNSVYVSYQNGMEFQMITGWGWSGQNQELQRFTQAVYAARELAMGRMQAEAQELGAQGIVGAQVTVNTYLSKSDAEFRSEVADPKIAPSNCWRDFVADVFAVGTAVAPIRADHEIAAPQLVLPLDG
jgi:uncharacterized protein YbjQ (UPF0145 family)